MGRRDNGDFRLLTQIEAQPQGAMCGEIADEGVGQGPVFPFFFAGLLLPILLLSHLALVGTIRLRCVGSFFALGSGLFVPRTDKPAFDPDRAVMIENDERTTARNVVGIVSLTPSLQPPDFGFKLAETRIHIIGKFLSRPILFSEAVELGSRRSK